MTENPNCKIVRQNFEIKKIEQWDLQKEMINIIILHYHFAYNTVIKLELENYKAFSSWRI